MRIFSDKRKNDIFFEFTEHKFENKIKSFERYAKTFTKKFFRRKDEISGCYIKYKFGYESKEPETYYTTEAFPFDLDLTQKDILKFAIEAAQVQHRHFTSKSDPDELQIYYLRGIQINFLYT
ncbi:MAG: hypothetical protein WC389_05445 [Lutibacter sp.]|jgi:hypothetical protein